MAALAVFAAFSFTLVALDLAGKFGDWADRRGWWG